MGSSNSIMMSISVTAAAQQQLQTHGNTKTTHLVQRMHTRELKTWHRGRSHTTRYARVSASHNDVGVMYRELAALSLNTVGADGTMAVAVTQSLEPRDVSDAGSGA